MSGNCRALQMNGGRIWNTSTITLSQVYPENRVLKYSLQTLPDAPCVAVCDDPVRFPRLYHFLCSHPSNVGEPIRRCTVVILSNTPSRDDEVLADGYFRVAA